MDVKRRLKQTFVKTDVRENRRSLKQTFEVNRWRLFSEPITGEPRKNGNFSITGEPKKNGNHNMEFSKERRLFTPF